MKLKKRNEIDNKYKWDIDRIIGNKDNFTTFYEEVISLCDELCTYKGKILENENTFYEFLKKYDEFDNKFNKLYIYAHMLCDTDTTNNDYQELKLKSEKMNEIVSNKLSFYSPEILKEDYQLVLDFINKNKKLEEYRFDLEEMFAYKKYILTEREEEIIAKLTNAYGTPYSIQYNINNADINLGTIKDANGEEVELSTSNYIQYMNSKNKDVRKSAFVNMYNYYMSLKNTIGASYKGKIKEDFSISELRGYNSPLESSLFVDRVDVSVYKKLIDKIHNNLDKMYEYLTIKKEALGLDELHMYDIYLSVAKEKETKIEFSEAKKIICEALKPLGDEYRKVIDIAFDNKWIDVYPNVGKKSGAYSWGTYGTNPYLLLNYNNTIDSVSTFAHELGHSIHSYFSCTNQNYCYHHYPIILAEIASTVNEMLLNHYLYENAKNDEERILYLSEFLEKVRTTIYRQTMFAEFEMLMHDKEKDNIPLTEKEFSDTYYNLNKLYYGTDVVSDDLIRYEWMRVPHFYTPFYVYKYATGLSIAIKIAYDIIDNKNNMKEKYIEFLKSGGSNYPLELLKKMDIDLNEGTVIDEALDLFEKKEKELKKILRSR